MYEYLDWSEKAAENASQLASEARLLFEAGHLARAYYLSHMSLEESAKGAILFGVVNISPPGDELSDIQKLLRNHKKKIEFIVNYATTNSIELARDVANFLPKLVDHINDLKNNTMYVSLEKGDIVTPNDKIADVDVGMHVAVAESFATYLVKVHLSQVSSL